MLTVKQPTTYGYKTVHDLPTPPSTFRPSPPPSYQESSSYRLLPPLGQSHSPVTQPMTTPHRGLPPPAAMALPPQQSSSSAPSTHHMGHHPPPPPPLSAPQQSQPHPQGQSWSALPAPPRDWQGSEDSMKNWLQAKTEEEKTKQEEEKTRQETLRLEQRKIEAEMLRASLGGGIPPPMVPLVFAGMGSGGVLPQQALEWIQQYIPSLAQHPQLMAAQAGSAPEHQREQAPPAHGQYHGSSTAPVSAPGSVVYGQHPGSPNRSRGGTTSGAANRPMASSSTLPSIGAAGAPGAQATIASHQVHQPPNQEQSSSIFFHHWQPPNSQAAGSSSGGVNRPGSPSGDTPKKRKATGPQQPSERDQRLRSPPSFASAVANPSRRGGHKRQRSDISWYRPSSGHERAEDERSSQRGSSPAGHSRERSRSEAGKHSVSSMLSAEPGDQASTSYPPQQGTGATTPYHSGQRTMPSSPIKNEYR